MIVKVDFCQRRWAFFIFAFSLFPCFLEANNAPVVTSTALTTATEDSLYSYSAVATDADVGSNLTWSVKSGTTLPSWLSLSSSGNTGTIIGTLTKDPGGLGIDTSGNYYVAELSGNTIHKITTAGTKTSWAAVNTSNKYGLLVNGDYLYVSYYSLGKITRILLSNPSAGESDWVTGIGTSGPLSMVVRNGDMYVAMYTNDVVKKINLTTKAVSNYVSTNNPFGLAFDSSGVLYIANIDNSYLSKYDGTTLTTNIKTITTPTDVKIDANNNLYVSTLGQGVKKLSSDLSTTTDIITGQRIWGMSLGANGSLVWGETGSDKVYALNTGAVLSGTPTNDHVGVHNISLSVSDGTATVDQVFQITVSNTNDAPVLTSGGNLSYTENAAASVVNGSITLTDVDSGAVAMSANVTISGNYSSSQDTLAFTNTGSITGSWNSTTGMLGLSGNASTSDYQSALRSITYANSSDNPSTAVRTLSWVSNDGFVNSANVLSYITVTAVNDAPTFTSTAVTAGAAGTAYSYTAVATDSEGDNLTYSLTTFPTGMTINAATGAISWTPTKGVNTGSDSVVVSVSDGTVSSTQSFTVTSTGFNAAPVITEGASKSVTMSEDASPTAFSLTLNATDADANTLTWSISTQANNGTASVSGTGASKSISYTPTANYNGADSFVVQVSDGTATDTITINVTITAVNDAPVITEGASKSVTMSEDASPTAFSLTLNATDAENSTLTWSISTQANNGTASVSGTGASKSISYTPTANYNGADSFVVQVSDGTATDTITINVTITAVNDAPVITEGTSKSVTMSEDGSPTAFSLTLNASDVDANTITWSIATQASNGTASASGTGTSKSISYTPTVNYNSTDSFVVQVSDGTATDTITVNVTIDAVNDTPVISNLDGDSLTYSAGSGNIVIDQSPSVTVSDNDSTTFSSLKISITSGADSTEDILNLPNQGSTAGQFALSGNTLNYSGNSIGAYTWTTSTSVLDVSFNQNATGNIIAALMGNVMYVNSDTVVTSSTRTVQFSLKDSVGGESSVNTSITFNNNAPTLAINSFNVSENSTIGTTVGTVQGSDDLGATLSYSITGGTGSSLFSINSSSGLVSVAGSLDYESQTSYTLETQISDGVNSPSFTVNISVQDVNEAPSFTGLNAEDRTLSLNQEFRLDIDGVDPEGKALTYSALGLPSWLSIDPVTGIIAGAPGIEAQGFRYAVAVSVSDGNLGSQQVLNLIVESAIVNVTSNVIKIRVLSDSQQPIQGAQVQIVGISQTLFTNALGEVSFRVGSFSDLITVRVSSNSYLGREESFLISSLSNQSKDIVLIGASITIKGTVTSGGSPLGLATVSAFHSSHGRFSAFTSTSGEYTLHIPQPLSEETWSFGASLEGYTPSTETISLDANSALTKNVTLVQSSKLSWSSFEVNGNSNARLIKIKSQPAFQSGDEILASVQLISQNGTVATGTVGSISYASSTKTLDYTYTRSSSDSKVLMTFSATPTKGTLASTLVRLDFSNTTSENIPISASHFIDRVRGSSGDLSGEKIIENGSEVTDLAAFEVPPFGVSENVDVIRIERKNNTVNVSGIVPTGKTYQIDAISIVDNVETILGSENITEILLTFPFDPSIWSSANGKIFYSEDAGVTWKEHNTSNIVFIDTDRSTVTVKSTHLSLWTLGNSGEGIFGNSGSGGSAGGGCFIK